MTTKCRGWIGWTLAAVLLSPPTVFGQQTRIIVPLQEFISVRPFEGADAQKNAATISRNDVGRLAIVFDRENLRPESGPQFVRINATLLDKAGMVLDQNTQYAFTFPREETAEKDRMKMEEYARQIMQFGFIAPGRSDSVQVRLDTLPDWGYLRLEVVPDQEYTKFTSRQNARIVWHYRIRGNWLDSKFALGIPKVIYDTASDDTVDYGNASAILRFFYIDQMTGKEFPVSLGVGLYGVSTPIDVSERGGGFVLSLYFDVVQFLRVNGLEITDKATAGFEIAPFIPVDKRTRILLSARIGYTP